MQGSALLQWFAAAADAAEEGGARPTPEADAFLAAIHERPDAFALLRAILERLPTGGYFETIVMTGHALAFGVLEGLTEPATIVSWSESPHPSVRKAAVAGWSSLAEHDPARVDVPALIRLSARIDAAEDDVDEVTIGLLARLAGIMRGHPMGIRLIEALASQGARARANAAQAIAYDRALDPPVAYFSAFPAPAPGPPEAPPRRLTWLLLSLLNDEVEEVATSARQAIALVLRSWPDAGHLAHLSDVANRSGGRQVLVWVGPPEDDPVPADLDGTIESALADLSARTGRAWTQDDLPALTHGVLDRKVSGPQRPRGIEYALRFPQMSNRQAGFLTWNPEVIDPQMEAEAAGREPVPIAHSPRLFLSYRWSEDIDVNAIIDHYASTLWALGYDIVYDRDPRHLDKQLTAADVLLLLPGSTHYVPLLTDEFSQFVTRRPPEPLSPLDLEWQLARRLRERPEPLRWLGLWLSGDQLPAPITPDTVDDVRSGSLSLGPMFPECRFRLTVTARDGSTRHHQHLRRHELVEAIGAANAEADSVAVEVRDVTRRPAVWSAPIRKRRRSRAGS